MGFLFVFQYIHPAMVQISRGLLLCSLVFIGFHTYGALSPSHYNWGYHYFAFFPPVFSAGVLAIALLIFIPRVRSVILSRMSASGGIARAPSPDDPLPRPVGRLDRADGVTSR